MTVDRVTDVKRWRVYDGYSEYGGRIISGATLAQAVERNWPTIAACASKPLGTAAGYDLDRVALTYRPDILGGKGGAEVDISHRGHALAHEPSDTVRPVKRSVVWIHADPADLPEPLDIPIRARSRQK